MFIKMPRPIHRHLGELRVISPPPCGVWFFYIRQLSFRSVEKLTLLLQPCDFRIFPLWSRFLFRLVFANSNAFLALVSFYPYVRFHSSFYLGNHLQGSDQLPSSSDSETLPADKMVSINCCNEKKKKNMLTACSPHLCEDRIYNLCKLCDVP